MRLGGVPSVVVCVISREQLLSVWPSEGRERKQQEGKRRRKRRHSKENITAGKIWATHYVNCKRKSKKYFQVDEQFSCSALTLKLSLISQKVSRSDPNSKVTKYISQGHSDTRHSTVWIRNVGLGPSLTLSHWVLHASLSLLVVDISRLATAWGTHVLKAGWGEMRDGKRRFVTLCVSKEKIHGHKNIVERNYQTTKVYIISSSNILYRLLSPWLA